MSYSKTRSKYLQMMYGELDKDINNLTINTVGDTSFEALEIKNASDIAQAQSVLDNSATQDPKRNWWQRIWDTVEDTTHNIMSGMLNFFDDVGDFVFDVVDWASGGNADWATTARDYNWQNKVLKYVNTLYIGNLFSGDMFQDGYWTDWTDEGTQKQFTTFDKGSYFAELEQIAPFGQGGHTFLKNAFQSIGYMLPSIMVGVGSASLGATTGVQKAGTLATMGAGAFSGKADEVYQATDGKMGKAVLTGLANSLVEIGAEMLFPNSAVMGVVGGGAVSSIKELSKTIAKEAVSEGVEETISAVLAPVVDSIWQGKEAFRDDKGEFIYFNPNFWFKGDDSVLNQFISGAFVGGLMSGVSTAVQSSQMAKEYGSDFTKIQNDAIVPLGEIYAEMQKLEAQSKQNTKQYQRLAESLAEPLAKLGAYIKLFNEGQLNLTDTQKNNIAKLFNEKGAYSKALANNTLDDYISERLSEYSSKEKIATRDMLNDFTTAFNQEVGLEFKDLGDDVRGLVNKETNTITINNKYESQFASIFAHEFLGHVINDNMSVNQRQALVERITKTGWYQKNAPALRKAYTETAEYKALNEQGKRQYWQSELVNKYIESVVEQGNNAKTIKLLNDAFIRNTLFNRLISNFKKINNFKIIKNNAVLSEFIKNVNTTLQLTNKHGYRVLNKALRGETLTPAEQKMLDRMVDAYDGLQELKASEMFSKELSPDDSKTKAIVAPFRKMPDITMETYEQVINEIKPKFVEKAQQIAKELGITIDEVVDNIGGFEFWETGEKQTEVSFTFNFSDATQEQADAFSMLLADLGHEVQEASISKHYVSEETKSQSNAISYEVKYKELSQELLDYLKNEVVEYTMNIDDKTIEVLYIIDVNDQDVVFAKVEKLVEFLGGNYEQEYGTRAEFVNSKYLDSENRQNAYQSWLETNNNNLRESGSNLYNLYEQAYEKVSAFNESKKQQNISTIETKKPQQVDDMSPLETNKAKEVKQIAHEKEGKVINLKTVRKVVDYIETRISEVLGENFNIKDKKGKVRRLFDDYNLTPKRDRPSFLRKYIRDILNQELVSRHNLSGQGSITYGDYLRVELGFKNKNQLIQSGVDFLNDILTKNAVDSDMTRKVNRLNKLIDKLATVNSKLTATVAFSKKLNAIKNQLRNKVAKYGNTGQLDTKAGVNALFYQYFSKFGFTKSGYLSMTNLTRLQTMVNDGSFDNFIKSILNPNYDVAGLSGVETQAQAIIDLATELVNSRTNSQTTLTVEQIIAFDNLNKAIYKMYNDYQSGVYEAIKDKSAKLIERAKIVRDFYNNRRLHGKLKQALFDALSPKDIIAYITGGTHTAEFNYLYNTLIKNSYEAQIDFYERFLRMRDKHTKSLLKTQHNRITIDGVKMPKYVLFQFYLNTLSPDNLIRMQNGNLTYTDRSGISHSIKYESLQEAIKQLTTAELNDLNGIFDLYNNEVKDYVEAISEKNLGFSVSRENYYPIVSSEAFKIADFTNPSRTRFNVNALSNNRLMKLSNRHTVIEINVNPINLFSSYIESMTITGEIGIASQELSRVLQMKDSNTKESFMSIISSYLPNSKVLMASIMNKLIGNTQVIERNGFFDGMVGRFSTATLGFNVRSMLKQFGSFFTAWEKVGLMNGLKVALNPTSFYRVMKNRKYIMQNNPVFRYRVYDNGFVKGTTLSYGATQFTSQAMQKLVAFSLKGMEFMDRMTAYATFALGEVYVEKTHGYKIGSAENMRLANDMLTDFILETQSNSDRIAMSRIRSGEKGVLMKNLFGLFQSDAQNKAGLLFNVINDANLQRYDRQELEKELSQTTDPVARQSVQNKLNNLSGQQAKTTSRAVAYASGLLLSSLITTLADLLADWLYDREDIEDFDLARQSIELLLNSTIDWLPYFNSIYNWFMFQDISFAPTETINDLIIAINDLLDGDIKKSDIMKLGLSLAQVFGLPANNMSKLIQGFLGNFNPEQAYKYRNLLYGLSQSYLGKEVNELVEKEKYNDAKIAISFNYNLYKYSIDDEVAKELINFKKNGVDLSINNAITYKLNEKGEKVELTDKELKEFREIYGLANDAIKIAMQSDIYAKLSLEEKAKVFKKISDTYYEIAKGQLQSRLSILMAKAHSKLSMARYVNAIVYLQSKFSHITENRKAHIIRALNKMKGLKYNDKLLIMFAMGYGIANENKPALTGYLMRLGFSRKDAVAYIS